MNTDNKALADFGQRLIEAFWDGYRTQEPAPFPIPVRPARPGEKSPAPTGTHEADYTIWSLGDARTADPWLLQASDLGMRARRYPLRLVTRLAEAGHRAAVLYGDWTPVIVCSPPQYVGALRFTAEFRNVLAAPDPDLVEL